MYHSIFKLSKDNKFLLVLPDDSVVPAQVISIIKNIFDPNQYIEVYDLLEVCSLDVAHISRYQNAPKEGFTFTLIFTVRHHLCLGPGYKEIYAKRISKHLSSLPKDIWPGSMEGVQFDTEGHSLTLQLNVPL